MIRYPSYAKLDAENLAEHLLTIKMTESGLAVLKGKASSEKKEQLEEMGFQWKANQWILSISDESTSDDEYKNAIRQAIRKVMVRFGDVLGLDVDRGTYKKLMPELLANY